MNNRFTVIQRVSYTLLAIVLFVVVAFPVFGTAHASAALLSSRSITMSDSGPSGGTITSGVGSGVGVTYNVAFTTTATANSLVIDFCSATPIINATCTAPTGMNALGAAVASSTGNIGGWTVTAGNSQVKLSVGSGSAATAGAQSFSLSGITNPSTVGSFYARIYTYSAASEPTYVSPTNVGTYADYGGIALTTVQTITITAVVAESLTFCVSGAAQTLWTTSHTCSDPEASVAPAVTLGHGTPTPTLDNTAVDTGSVYSQLSTNATSGAAVTLRNSNSSCGGLSSNGGTSCAIPPVGATAHAITAGTADFGLFVANSSDYTGGTGSLTPASNYNDGVHTTAPTYYYGMDAANVDSTYGDIIATTNSPCYLVNTAYTFGATASLTTPAGLYSANLDMIATGTF